MTILLLTRAELCYNIYLYPWGVYRRRVMETTNDKIKQDIYPNCACKIKHRDKEGKEYKDLFSRLNRIEGQVRGIKNMLEEDRYCVDILTQVSAISCALNSFNKKLLAQHIKSCVVNDIREGKDEVIEELCVTLQKLMK
jgi:CsoR family transcriptional regulator, copper-sensing transcriptional repressor